MNKSRTPQIFFILAALTLAAGTGATVFQWQEIGDKWDSLAELKKNVRDPKDIQTEFEETSTKVASSSAELEHLEKGIPVFAYVPTMLRELELFGKQNGLEVLGIRPIPKVETKDKNGKRKKAPYEEIAIEVKGRGAFKSVHSFVSALQKFPKIVSARAVSLAPKEVVNQPGKKTLDVTIELRAFLFPPTEGQEESKPTLTMGKTAPAEPAGPGSEAGNAPQAEPKPNTKAAPAVAVKPASFTPQKAVASVKSKQVKASRKAKAPRKFFRRRARR